MLSYNRPLLLAINALSLATVARCAAFNCSSFGQSVELSSYNATILNSTHYAVGELNEAGTVNAVPFCEVYASVGYGTNDTIIFALWLPDEQYSSRFMAVGNGGQGGVIPYTDMMEELNSGLGFAVAGGNAGHLASDNDAGTGDGLGAPGVYQPFLHDEDQVKAWLHNAISLITPPAKELIRISYGGQPEHSYYRGCSAGGAQGFSLAEFHPDLFDGVIAGCPANWFTRLILGFLWNSQQASTNATFLSDSVLEFIQASVIRECDLIDGVADNLVENPLACSFNISSLACTEGSSAGNVTCLTPDQLSAVRAIYQGPVRSDDPSKSLWPGVALGSEAGWSLPIVQGLLSYVFAVPILQNLVYDDLAYDPATFNWGSDVEVLEERAGGLINSIKTDLSSFRDRGGKMIVFAGWADPNIAPEWSIQHVEAITQDTIGPGTTIAENDFVKLVMVPGGGHCGANIAKYPYVPAHYGFSTAMVDWIEKGQEPVEGIKSWGPTNGDERTRRLCTWPQGAKLKEGGNVDDWESYTCE
ncbi:unnamed protein product [Clonostachys chloroleuca]|uniref:Carboxylic ester hydrolase n=1 Tax=Clonostachys chloroleuca TaxID=1926264 RepID=A0AA35LXN0_9HYPO|nr:unnamed protein product [Clonostachys chloroleuca]